MITILLIILLAMPVFAQCNYLADGKKISKTTKICGQNYPLPNGIKIIASDIIFDCGNAVLQGEFENKNGITIENQNNVQIKNCILMNYENGITLINSTNITLINNGLLRNNIGIKLENSHNNTILENRDVSLKQMIKETESKDNLFHYENKNAEGDYCRYNYCNQITRNYSLKAILMEAIRVWIEEW